MHNLNSQELTKNERRNETHNLGIRQMMAITADIFKKEWKGRLKSQGNTG